MITPISNTTVSSSIRDLYLDSPNNLIYTVDAGNALRAYNISTLTQTFAATGLTNTPAGVCLINTSSAVIPNFNVTTVDFVELSTGYKQAISGSTAGSFQRQQLVAADMASGIAYFVAGGRTLVKITASPQSCTSFSLPVVETNSTFQCVILKSTGRWLVGTNYGGVYEIDSTGTVVDNYKILLSPSTGTTLGVSMTAPIIMNLSYGDNILAIATELGIYFVDWTTKAQVGFAPYSTSTSTPNIHLSNASSGICVQTAEVNSVTAELREIDMCVRPGSIPASGVCTTVSTNSIAIVSLNPTTGVIVAVQSGTTIQTYQLAPRASTTRTFTAPSSPCRLSLIDDGGSGPFVFFDTMMNSPATYRVPTGKTVIEMKKYDDGATAGFDVSSYST